MISIYWLNTSKYDTQFTMAILPKQALSTKLQYTCSLISLRHILAVSAIQQSSVIEVPWYFDGMNYGYYLIIAWNFRKFMFYIKTFCLLNSYYLSNMYNRDGSYVT